jgi:coproporphyrinogen III oxidase-like Fe-S oxidoreductase
MTNSESSPAEPSAAKPGCIVLSIPFGTRPDPDTGCPVTDHSTKKADKFTNAICREIELRAAGFRGVQFDTAWLRGGPTCLSLDQLYRILQVLYDNITSEMAAQAIVVLPGTVDDGRAKVLAESGFDRAELVISDPDKDGRDFELLRSARFNSADVALDFSADGREWERKLDAVMKLDPDCLRFRMPGKFEELTMLSVLRRTRERLAAAGYEATGLHRYARPGKAASRFPAPIDGTVLAGFGPGAATFAGREAWLNRPDFNGYVSQAGSGESPARSAEPRLRIERLLSYGLPVELVEPEAVRKLVERGLLERRDGRLHVTDQGALFYERVLADLERAAEVR